MKQPPVDGLLPQGNVLVAAPHLFDPNFRQTLVFVANHDQEGTLGFVMNRPIGKTLGELVPSTQNLGDMAKIPVCFGGPVNPQQIVIAVFRAHASDSLRCSIHGGPELWGEELQAKGAWVRAYLGYSGWSAGQLQEELTESSWKIARPSPALFNPRFHEDLWAAYASGDERWRTLLPFLPEDASLN